MTASPKNLSVVIVNYRTPDLVIGCLTSLLPELKPDDAVVIVDNASGDGSLEILRQWLSSQNVADMVKLVASPCNGGFSAGNNLGILAQPANYYLLLNSDTIVRPGAVTALLSAAVASPAIGILGPCLEGSDGQPQVNCFRNPSPMSEIIDAARTGPVTRLLSHFDVPLHDADGEVRPDWISYACALIRREAILRAGLLDEGFFMYYEDAEHCHRVRRAGFDIRYVPIARVIHLHGGSSQIPQMARMRKRLPGFFYQSRARYFRLIHGRIGLVLANLCWMLGRVVSLLRELFGRESHVPPYKWLDIWHTRYTVIRR